MRLPLALLATATAAALTLTGCTAAPEPEAAAGTSSDLIEVEGEFGEEPSIDFPTPLTPSETQCTEVIEGEGELIQGGQFVFLGASLLNGETGDVIQSVGFGDENPAPLLVGGKDTPVAFTKGLTCAREGSRVAIAASPNDLVLPGDDSASTEGQPSLVIVFDVRRAFPAKADGAPQLTRDGFPAVVTAPDGRPGITVPETDPFEDTEVEVIRLGDGEEVEAGDEVVVHFTGVRWDGGSLLEGSTWEQGAPEIVVVGDEGAAQGSPPFAASLEGRTVGSQLGIALPGDESTGGAVFYVVDILGVV